MTRTDPRTIPNVSQADRSASPPAPPAERGHLLVGLMVLIAVMLIMLTVTAQSWTFLLRRDAEAELIFRGEQYAKALGFYHKENTNYPNDPNVLIKPGPHRHRYIRKLYKDPLAKDGKWGYLYLSPTGKGFINPYATLQGAEAGEDGFGEVAGPVPGLRTRSSAPRESLFDRDPDEAETSGYSEMSASEFEATGGERMGLPIVGVVHRKKEGGLKIYKNQANLNDWAFTLMAEGEAFAGGGVAAPRPGKKRDLGIGDHTSPIRRPGEGGPGGVENPFAAQRRKDREARRLWEEEQERKREAGETDENEEDPDREQTDDPVPDEPPPPDDEDQDEDLEGDDESEGDEDGEDEEDDEEGEEDEEDPGDDDDDSGEDDGDDSDPNEPGRS